MFADITNNTDIAFATSLVALILAAVVLAQSRLQSIIAWSAGIGFLGLVLVWWPT